MAVVHQKVGAVLLRRNRILRRRAEDFEGLDAELDAAGRASLFPDGAGDAHRRFLRRRIRRRPRFLGHFLLEDDALQIPAAIPHDRKLQLPRRTLVVQPPIDGDLFADMLRQILDPNSAHKGGGLYLRGKQCRFARFPPWQEAAPPPAGGTPALQCFAARSSSTNRAANDGTLASPPA